MHVGDSTWQRICVHVSVCASLYQGRRKKHTVCSDAQGHVCLHFVCTQACLPAYVHGSSNWSLELWFPFLSDTKLKIGWRLNQAGRARQRRVWIMRSVRQAWDEFMLLAVSELCFRVAPCFQVCMRTDTFLSLVVGGILKARLAPQLPRETQTR